MLPQCDNTTECICRYDSHFDYDTCDCTDLLDPYYFCNKTVFEAYQGLDLIYPGLGLPIYFVIFLMYLFEAGVDLYRRQFSPILVTKISLILFTLSRFPILILWIVSSTQKTATHVQAVTLINSIGTIVLVSAHILIVVSWLEMVQVARNLGDQDKRLRGFKLGLFISVLTITPLNILALVLSQNFTQAAILLVVTVGALLLLTLITIIVSIVYLVRIFKWIRSQPHSTVLDLIQRKGWWVVAILVLMLVTIVYLTTLQTVDRELPMVYLGTEIGNRLIEILMSLVMFFFLERVFLISIKNRGLTLKI